MEIPARPVRVVILYRTALFGEGLASLLRDVGDIEVVAAVPAAAPGRMAGLHPQAIIMEAADEPRAGRCDADEVAGFLHRYPDALVIRVSSRRNVLDLYAHSSLTANVERLVSLLRGSRLPPVEGRREG